MPDSFGARLRERREQQQVALTTIAEQTKIKVSLLEALERDDVSHWPSGIFRRAFVRAYAHAIGLEPDVIVREFLDLHPDPIEIVDTLQAGAPGSEGAWVSDGPPPTRFHHMVASAIGSVTRLRARGTPRPGPETDGVIPSAVSTGSMVPAHAAATFDDRSPDLSARELVGTGCLSATNQDLRIPDHGTRTPDTGRIPDPGSVTASSFTLSGQIARETIHDERLHTRMPDSVESAVTEVVHQPDDDPTLVITPATDGIVGHEPSSYLGRSSEPDLMEVAELCTEFGRVETAVEVQPLLQETARILDAVGLIVWAWDPIANELRPALAHGYSDRVLAQLPRVERDTNNATAAAFRAAQTCVVKSSGEVSGALAVPLMTPAGCAGVLAIELTHRQEDRGSVRALATIFAAQLAAIIGAARPAEASGRLFA
jgi:transcriptional regulator with XRE-family HTH domain